MANSEADMNKSLSTVTDRRPLFVVGYRAGCAGAAKPGRFGAPKIRVMARLSGLCGFAYTGDGL